MPDEQGYNGWKNYETWVMGFWIDNDQWSYNTAREVVRDAYTALETNAFLQGQPEDLANRYATGRAADALRDWQEEQMPEIEGVWTDLLRAAFSEIDWYEIAENMLAEVDA